MHGIQFEWPSEQLLVMHAACPARQHVPQRLQKHSISVLVLLCWVRWIVKAYDVQELPQARAPHTGRKPLFRMRMHVFEIHQQTKRSIYAHKHNPRNEQLYAPTNVVLVTVQNQKSQWVQRDVSQKTLLLFCSKTAKTLLCKDL